MIKFFGNTLIGFLRCANGNLPLKPFSFQRET